MSLEPQPSSHECSASSRCSRRGSAPAKPASQEPLRREESSAKKQRTRSPVPDSEDTAASSMGFELPSSVSVAAAAVLSPTAPHSFLVGLLRPNLLLLYALLSWWLGVILHALLSARMQITSFAWLNAIVVSAVVGSALNANAWPSDRCSLQSHLASAPIACARFFAIPFCVSSYSAIASQNPRSFCWIVPRSPRLVAALVAAIAVEVAALWTLGRWMRRRGQRSSRDLATAPNQLRTADAAVQVDSSLLSPHFNFGFSSPCSVSSGRSIRRRRGSCVHRFSPAATSVAPPALRVEPLATYLGSAITPRAQTQRAARTVGLLTTPRPLLLESCATPTPRVRNPALQLFGLLLESDAGRLHPALLRCIAEYAELSSCRSSSRGRPSPATSSFTFR